MSVALFATLLSTITMSAQAATTPEAVSAVAPPPIEQVLELDEIWVRGKSLSDMIEDAENDFIRLYNKLNKKNNFDVVCDYLRLDRNSLALRRTCVPYFIGYLNSGFIPPAQTSMCMGGTYANMAGFGRQGVAPGYSGGNYYRTSCTSFSPYAPPMPMPTLAIVRLPDNSETPRLRQEYARTLMRTIYRDQRLLDEATTLADLYQEMKTVQDQYRKIKVEDDARKAEARRLRREQRGLRLGPAPPNKGPRA